MSEADVSAPGGGGIPGGGGVPAGGGGVPGGFPGGGVHGGITSFSEGIQVSVNVYLPVSPV